jgi:hypothetical protein
MPDSTTARSRFKDEGTKSQPKPREDRPASEIDIPNLSTGEMQNLTDRELRHCIVGATNRSRCPGSLGRGGFIDLRKLKKEFNRRYPGRKPPTWRTSPPPPLTSK